MKYKIKEVILDKVEVLQKRMEPGGRMGPPPEVSRPQIPTSTSNSQP